MDVILGVDGGGTKTSIIAIDMKGNVVATSVGGSINYNFVGMEEAVCNLVNAVTSLNLPDDANMACMSIGHPSIDDVTEDENSCVFMDEILKRINVGRVYMKSDAFMALYGVTKGNSGVLIISGTGSMGIGIDKEKRIHVVGGWGRPTLDNGSAYCIGVLGMNAAFDAFDGVGKGTMLVDAVCKYFGVSYLRDVIPILNGDNIKKSDLAGFAVEVARCAFNGDMVAKCILENAALKLSDYAISLIETINDESLVVGIYGGVFQNNEYIRGFFTNRIREKYPLVEIRPPGVKPEMAACIYALGEIENDKN